MARKTKHSRVYDGNAARKINKQPKVTRRDRQKELIRITEADILRNKRKNTNYAKVTKNVACAALMFSLLGGVVYGEVTITELQSEINTAQSYLSELQGTQVQLEMQVINSISESEIDEYAKYVLGMEQIDQNQVIYIDSYEGDKGTVYDEEYTGIFQIILSWFGF